MARALDVGNYRVLCCGPAAGPLDALTPAAPARRRVGYLTFAILALVPLPFPHALWHAAGIYCPGSLSEPAIFRARLRRRVRSARGADRTSPFDR